MHVLVVEDDEDVRTLLDIILTDHGATVTRCGDADEARRADWDSVDVALVDWMLPGEDGVSLARWIAATHPHVRVVILTAAPDALSRVGTVSREGDEWTLHLNGGAVAVVGKQEIPWRLLARLGL